MTESSRTAPWCDTIHSLSLSLWLAALVLGGVSAAVMFPAMKTVNPTLADFPGLEPDHWKIAAGMVQRRIFFVSDFIQFIAAIGTFITLGLRLIGAGIPRAARRAATLVRTVAVGAAMLLLSYHLLVLAPRLDDNLTTFYAQAQAGNLPAAQAARAAFDADHPIASSVLGTMTICVLAGLWASIWPLAGPLPDLAEPTRRSRPPR